MTEMGLTVPFAETAVPLVGVQVALKLVAAVPVLAAVKFTLAALLPEDTLTRVGDKGAVGVGSVGVVVPVAVSVTEEVATLLLPSVMVMVATYAPATSALKLGLAAVGLASEALLPEGTELKAHE